MKIDSIEALQAALKSEGYIAEADLSTALYLGIKMGRPVFLEGEAGVGKTEVAKALAGILDTELIRLQCYEGLGVHEAVYEWNYTRQMLHIRMAEAQGDRLADSDLYGEEFLLPRPLLQAIKAPIDHPPVLLIDEIDRSDMEFEAYLLELLSDFQVTIPELGTIRAESPPIAIITSNRTREIHDALKRRCIYHWLDYPSYEKETEIVRERLPKTPEKLTKQAVAFVQALRKEDLYKYPGMAETLDWVQAMRTMGKNELSTKTITDTLGLLLKYRDDVERIQHKHSELLDAIKSDND
ncbi:MAG: MoxR family ATPase [Anaerolineae bacterium]|nr:MoxR family ATPase [Anaerolineae bacterium]